MNIKNAKTIISAIVAVGSIMSSTVPANAASCHVYSVNIQGATNQGNTVFYSAVSGTKFNVNQWAILRSSGYANNPIEFSLTTFADLNASAQIGKIELNTNSAFARNSGIASQRYDLAKVTASRNKVSAVYQFRIDSVLSKELPSPNVFVSYGVAFPARLTHQYIEPRSRVLYPRNGGGYVYSPDGKWSTITGEVTLISSGIISSGIGIGNEGRYKGRFKGFYHSKLEC